jgi:nucleotide-binding universal stress UspA family protein
MGVVVVDVDFSEGAKSALRFALVEARLRDAALRVVHAWRLSGIDGTYPIVGRDRTDARRAAEDALEAILAEVVSDEHTVEVVSAVVEGSAGAVPVTESQDAELLVVASRGHGGFAGLLLGSVSQQCADHVACPVAIVPHKRGS